MTDAIDRVRDPAYLEGLDGAPIADVRRKLGEARGCDDELSFVRRLIHGKLDLLKAELERRQPGADGSDEQEIVDRLRQVLGQGVGGSRGARPRTRTPDADSAAVRSVERILGDGQLGRLPERSTDELSDLVDRLMAEERKVSADRRAVLDVVDALEEELVRRYEADPSEATRSFGPPRS